MKTTYENMQMGNNFQENTTAHEILEYNKTHAFESSISSMQKEKGGKKHNST